MVGDFGVGYGIPTETIRRFKRAHPSYGNVFGAPEIRGDIRSDKNQTPYEFPSSRSDIYSLGIIMLEFLQLPGRRYTDDEWDCLDLHWSYTKKYYPYSPNLLSLARQCVNNDAMQRPSPLILYKETGGLAHRMRDVTVKEIHRAREYGLPAGVYNGMVLWNKEDQEKYTTDEHFRKAFRKHADWFGRHAQDLIDLEVTALDPECPPYHGYVGIANGLGGFVRLAWLQHVMAGVPEDQWLREYDPRPEDNGIRNLQYIGQDRLRFPDFDENWRAHTRGVGRDDMSLADLRRLARTGGLMSNVGQAGAAKQTGGGSAKRGDRFSIS